MEQTVDLHLHSNFSDGSESPAALLQSLRGRGIRIFSLTDHDTIDGSVALAALVPPDLQYIHGVEFSCRTEAGPCHILGYRYDPGAAALQAVLEKGRKIRARKLQERFRFLQERHSITLTQQEMDALRAIPCVGKPHIASVLIARGLCATIDEAIQTYLSGFRYATSRIDAAEAIRAITTAGGFPVWAHPLGGEGEAHLDADAFRRQFEILRGAGIRGLECFYSRYTMQEAGFLLDAARQYGLLVSGGSDYHGANKRIAAGTLNADGRVIPAAQLTILHEIL